MGTSVQMKMNLIAEISAKGTSLTMWDIGTFLDKISPTINNIIVREPSLKIQLNTTG